MLNINELKAKVNARLDARDLLRRIGWFPDSIREFETGIKCFCPAHQGRLRTLIIDPRRRTCRCAVMSCPASAGGLLVDLWGWWRRLSPIEGLIDLVSHLGIELDDATHQGIVLRVIEQAEQALLDGDLGKARRLADLARQARPYDLAPMIFHANLLRREGDTPQAIEEMLKIAQRYIESDRPDRARDIWRKILSIDAGNEHALDALAFSYRHSNEVGNAIALFHSEIAALRQDDTPERAIDLYRRILELDPGRAGDRRALADLLTRIGRIPEALAQWRILADECEHQDDVDQAIDFLRKMADLDPAAIIPLREEIAGLLEKAGRPTAARAEYQCLVEALLAKGDRAAARRIGLNASRLADEELPLRFHLARRFEEVEATDLALEEYLGIARRAQDLHDDRALVRACDAGLLLAPDNLDLRRWRAMALKKDAISSTIALSAPRKGDAALNDVIANYLNILRLNPSNADVRRQLAQLLDHQGRREEAIDHWLKAAECMALNAQIEPALSLLKELAGRAPDDARIRSLLSRVGIRHSALRAVDSVIRMENKTN